MELSIEVLDNVLGVMETIKKCCGGFDDNFEDVKYELLKNLKEYMDLKEQGRLWKLPCVVGNVVWDNSFGYSCACEVTGFSFGELNDDEENDVDGLQMYYRNWNGSIRCSCAISEIEKTVFLTKESAEAALKEMGE